MKYDYIIVDSYYTLNGDIYSMAKVTFKGDKDEITFEELEGRRFYFKKLIRLTLGSAQYIDLKK